VILASASLLPVLGIDPMLGRAFSQEESRPGAPPVALFSEGFWQRRFGAAPDIVGQTILLDGVATTVLGVLPKQLEKAWGAFDVWAPLVFDVGDHERGAHNYFAIGRLKPGITVDEAQAEMETIAARLATRYPESNQGWTAEVMPIIDFIIEPEASVAVTAMMILVVLVLLIACANVANLLLARGSVRRKELAIRSAVGAGKWRLARQVVTECALLALAGGALGVLLAIWGVEFLIAVFPDNVPRKADVVVDGQVLAFTLLISLGAAVLSGLVPAWKSSRNSLCETLKEGTRSSSAGERHSLKRDVLLSAQVAMAFALVICAGLMTRSFRYLQSVDPGFETGHRLTMHLKLPLRKYETDERRATFVEQATRVICGIPGVRSVAAVSSLPLSGMNSWYDITIDGQTPARPEERISAGYIVATPGYFETMGIPLLRGRDFTFQDTLESRHVVIVSENLASRFWPSEDPIGKRLKYGAPDSEAQWRTVIGVTGDVKHIGVEREARLETYRPYAQTPGQFMVVIAQTQGDPAAATSAVQQAIWDLDPDLALYRVRTLEDVAFHRHGVWGVYATLLGVFAAIALLIASVGLYGVMAYSVSQRTHEIGIRMALGAQVRHVLRLVVTRSATMALIGVTVGSALALALGSALQAIMYGVTPADPVTFLCVGLVMITAALVASYLPVRLATKVDPMVALRYE
jgi:putative ABC transport system permease protein